MSNNAHKSIFITLHKTEVQVNQRPHVKVDSLNLLEQKRWENLLSIGTGKNFLKRTPRAQVLKSTVNKWDLIKLKSFCKTKDTARRTKMQAADM